MIGIAFVLCAGLSFDFNAVSAARFREDPTSVNLVATTGSCPVFNYHPTATADVLLSFADGDGKSVQVPAAGLKVFEFAK